MFFILDCLTHPEKKLHYHAIWETIEFWDLLLKTKKNRTKKRQEKNLIFIIAMMINMMMYRFRDESHTQW